MEVLRELALEEIQNLAELYGNYREEFPHIHSFLFNCIKWRKQHQKNKYIEIFAVQDEWKSDGTFIALCQLGCYDVIVNTLDKSNEKIHTALANTSKIDWKNKKILFYTLNENHIDLIDELMTKKGLTKLYRVDTHIWSIPREKALKKTVNCPEGYKIDKLQVQNAELVNENWLHSSLASLTFVKSLITLNTCYGAFTREGQLVAWILRTHLGQPGVLHTLEGHKNKGLASALINKLALDVADEGHSVIATVVPDNEASRNLFAKLDFSILNLCTFVGYQCKGN